MPRRNGKGKSRGVGEMHGSIKIIVALSALAIGVAAIYAMRFSRFVPSPLETRVAFAAATACAIGGIALGFTQARPGAGRWLQLQWVRIPVFGLLSFGFGYLAFAAGFPAWYTAAFGHPSHQIVTVEKWRFPSRWSCAGPDIAEAPFLSTICLDYKNEQIVPVGSKLILRGAATDLGLNVETVAVP